MYSFGRAALLLLVEAQNHTVPVRERRRIRVNVFRVQSVLVGVDVLLEFEVYHSSVADVSSYAILCRIEREIFDEVTCLYVPVCTV